MTEKRKRKTSLDRRLEADPEFKAAYEYFNEERMVERIKQGYREVLQRERRETERMAEEERRRRRLRRLTFGLFPR